MKRKILSILLILCMAAPVLSAPVFAAEGSYSDTSGHWAGEAIERWTDLGVLTGFGGKLRPNDTITRAEMAAILYRVMKYQNSGTVVFTDVSPSSWYHESVVSLAAAGVIQGVGGGRFEPNRGITREEATVMIARAFHVDGTAGGASQFSDADEISGWAAEAVGAMGDAGYITGYRDDGFYPKNAITRAEAITILDNVVGACIMSPGVFDYSDAGNINGLAVISASGATVKNMTVNGDLIIAAGVGEGEVFLENVEVTGRVFIEGGGENSIHFNDCNIRELVITKNNVRVVLSNGSVVEFARCLSGNSVFEIGSGTSIGTLTIIGEGVTVVMGDGASVRSLNADANNTYIDMSAGASIGTANLNGETKITGSGSISVANVNTNNCEIEIIPGTVNLKDGVTVLLGGQMIPGGAPVPLAPFPPGGGGGGSVSYPVFLSHSAPDKTNIPFGTPFEELDLPAIVTLYASMNASCTAGVIWDESGYDPESRGMQYITGAVFGADLPAWAPETITVTAFVLPRPVPVSLTIRGENELIDPLSVIHKGASIQFTAYILDQNGMRMTDQNVEWSLPGMPDGVSVSPDGLVTVAPDSTALEFTLRAQCGLAIGVHTVTVEEDSEEIAPKVTNLRISEYDDLLYIEWTTPEALPYAVQYWLEIVDEHDTVVRYLMSFLQDPSDPNVLGMNWAWEILFVVPEMPGIYRLRVITVAVHNSSLNSAPVYLSRTLEVDDSIEVPWFSEMIFLGLVGDDMEFMATVEDNQTELDDGYIHIEFNYGTGWSTSLIFPFDMYTDEIRWLVSPAWGGGGVIDPSACFVHVFVYEPISYSGENILLVRSYKALLSTQP